MTSLEQSVLRILKDNKQWRAPGSGKIAKQIGYSKTAVAYALRRLKNAGIISQEGKPI